MAANGTAVVGGSDALLCSESDLDALVKEFDHWQKVKEFLVMEKHSKFS